jgi:hypothetical protein
MTGLLKDHKRTVFDVVWGDDSSRKPTTQLSSISSKFFLNDLLRLLVFDDHAYYGLA